MCKDNESKVEKSTEQSGIDVIVSRQKSFKKELESLINCHSQENGSDTPDFILAEYLADCLKIFDKATKRRMKWYSIDPENLQNQTRR